METEGFVMVVRVKMRTWTHKIGDLKIEVDTAKAVWDYQGLNDTIVCPGWLESDRADHFLIHASICIKLLCTYFYTVRYFER